MKLLPVLVAFSAAQFSAVASAELPPLRIDREVTSTRDFSLELGQNRLMISSVPLGRVSVANPDVADLKVVTSTQLLVTAKGVGDTYLTLWDKSDAPLVMSLHVARNLDGLRKQLKELFPAENIRVSSSGELIVLAGEVTDVRVPERIIELAKLHSSKVANMLQVSGNQQEIRQYLPDSPATVAGFVEVFFF